MEIEGLLELLLPHVVSVLHVVLDQFDTHGVFGLLVFSHEIGVQFATPVVRRDEILLESFEAVLLVPHYVFEDELNILQKQVWSVTIYIHLKAE